MSTGTEEDQTHQVVIALGSNLGDRLELLQAARSSLSQRLSVSLRSARVYESEPVGKADQKFLNTAVSFSTSYEPEKLLYICKDIERRLGRDHSAERWSNRPIDLDIITYGDQTINTRFLTIPHPEYRKRLFVLLPLADLFPTWIDPITKTPIPLLIDAVSESKPELRYTTW
jgi:2-amino-4-hydroxy-6-hydroxymethyldihydropteridine diphosphokinase